MSDAISLLVEPYKEDATDLEAYRTLISFACLAWNMTILPEKDRQDMLNEMTALAPDLESRVETIALIAELMDRKHMLFPDVKRMIVEFKVTEQGNDLHLSIASTLSGKADPN